MCYVHVSHVHVLTAVLDKIWVQCNNRTNFNQTTWHKASYDDQESKLLDNRPLFTQRGDDKSKIERFFGSLKLRFSRTTAPEWQTFTTNPLCIVYILIGYCSSWVPSKTTGS